MPTAPSCPDPAWTLCGWAGDSTAHLTPCDSAELSTVPNGLIHLLETKVDRFSKPLIRTNYSSIVELGGQDECAHVRIWRGSTVPGEGTRPKSEVICVTMEGARVERMQGGQSHQCPGKSKTEDSVRAVSQQEVGAALCSVDAKTIPFLIR